LEKQELKEKILELKERLPVTIVAHYYQRDEVFEMGDITGDSLELARRCKADSNEWVVFCGVGFMGESINSSAAVKASVGKMGGMVCTSSNAYKIIEKGLESGKKILFVPDRCLGQNIANMMGLKSCVIGDGSDPKEADVICYNGFCSVHQLFTVDDVEFYRKRYPGIKIAVHPECDPSVVAVSDFCGSTSQLIKYVAELPEEQKVAVGTEYNLVHRMREKNIYVLSSTKPECPTMNETTLEDLYNTLLAIEKGEVATEIHVDPETAKWANTALERMLAL